MDRSWAEIKEIFDSNKALFVYDHDGGCEIFELTPGEQLMMLNVQAGEYSSWLSRIEGKLPEGERTRELQETGSFFRRVENITNPAREGRS